MDDLGQASICTEWEQSSMVLNPSSQVGATVTTRDKAKTAASVSPPVSPPRQQSQPKSPAATMAGISSILQVGLKHDSTRQRNKIKTN